MYFYEKQFNYSDYFEYQCVNSKPVNQVKALVVLELFIFSKASLQSLKAL